jgi:hypothetical protein
VKQLGFPKLKLPGPIIVMLPNYHYNVALAALVPREAAITAMCFDLAGFAFQPSISAFAFSSLV